MKLLKIRLHPFGGTNDRTYDLQNGLNVIEGPNEYGKSTLREALSHGLHTTSKLTPKNLEKTMGPWYPLPAGDHVRVTIEFEAAGKHWMLEKTWGAGAASRLREQGGNAMADPDKVQGKLAELLKLNEATWKQVLFTGQAELARTVDTLRDLAGDLNDVEKFLAGPAAIPGDTTPGKLQQAIDEQVERHYGRWDRQSDGPEGGRGLDRPWQNLAGPLVKAYYDKEKIKHELEEVRSREHDLEEVNKKIREVQGKMKEDAEFVETNKPLRAPLTRRIELEKQAEQEERKAAELKKAAAEWPKLEADVDSAEKELAQLEKQLGKLKQEKEVAQKHRDVQSQKEAYEQVKKKEKELDEAKKKRDAAPDVDSDKVRKLAGLEQAIKELDIQIDAQRLAASIQARKAFTATLQRGAEKPEKLELKANEAWEEEVPGRLVLKTDAFTLTVKNALDEDVDQLLEQREAVLAERKELLKELGFKKLETANEGLAKRAELDQLVNQKNAAFQTALGNKALTQ